MLRLSLVRDEYNNAANDASRHRLSGDSKFQEGLGSAQSDNNLFGISNKTEWHDYIAHAWTVESIPKNTRFDDVSTSASNAANSSTTNNNATMTIPSTAPHRTSSSSSSSNTKQQQIMSNRCMKYVALCLGTNFTQEMCHNPASSLPVQILKRFRASGSSAMSVLCNVAVIIGQPLQNQVTIRDLTEQLLPEEIVAEAALFSQRQQQERLQHRAAAAAGNTQTPRSTSLNTSINQNYEQLIPEFLERNQEAVNALHLPADDFRFVRCGADSYGGAHPVSSPLTPGSTAQLRNSTSTSQTGSRFTNLNQRQPEAALVESLVQSLSESESFCSSMGRTSVIFSFYDESTHSSAQIWMLADAHLPLFGQTELLIPGVWKEMSSAMSIARSLSQETVLFATTPMMALAPGKEHFDRILFVTVSSATITGNDTINAAAVSSNDLTTTTNKRTQLLQLRQQQEQLLKEMQKQVNQSGTSTEKLAAERQYQRLLVGEIELLERRIEEVKALTDQERSISEELDGKYQQAHQNAQELEARKRNLVSESRALNEENRSHLAVTEALQQQIQMLEQRLAAASTTIVAHRNQQNERRLRSSSSGGDLEKERSAKEREHSSRHEQNVTEAQKHFAEVQQKTHDDNRDTEEQFNSDVRSLQDDNSALQRQIEVDSSRLGELRANWKANDSLKESLDKEFQALRESMNKLMEGAPELASAKPDQNVLDERREKLQRSVAEHKAHVLELKSKLDQTRQRRETIEENVLASERHLQKVLAQIQLRIPPQLEAQREHLCDEEQCMRNSRELEQEASFYELQNHLYLSLYDRVHSNNARRHRRRHEELKMDISVAEEKALETEEKLRQAQASSDVFAKRMDECTLEQQRLREEHRKTIIDLQHNLITAESEPVEEAVKKEFKMLQARIASANAEIELIQGAMLKSPSAALGGSGANSLSGGIVSSIAAATLAGSSTTFAMHRSLRAAAPVASEIRQRLKQLRRDSYKRQRIENAKAAEIEQRLDNRRHELSEKATLISTIRTAINELHEQLTLRTAQAEERKSELEQLKRSEEAVINDLEEELQYAKEISNRHKNENRLQLTRVTQVMQEQEQELARSRHEVAKLERKRNNIVRKMSNGNEATLLIELEHEQQKRDELRVELEKAGIAASPSRDSFDQNPQFQRNLRSISSDYVSSQTHSDNDDDENQQKAYFYSSKSASTKYATPHGGRS